MSRTTTTDTERLRRGRKIPNWTAALDWVALAEGVPPVSHSLYVKLRMYLNEERGDGIVWPGMDRLAEMMGFEKAESVGRWLKPLIQVGAIDVIKVGMPARSEYILHDLPPEDYDGPMTLRDWSKRHKAAIDARVAASRGKTRLSRDRKAFYLHATPPKGYEGPLTAEEWAEQHRAEVARRKDVEDRRGKAKAGKATNAQVSLDTPQNGLQANREQAGPPVTPENGLHVTPQSGGHVPPQNGFELPVVELAVVELHEEQPPPPATGAAVSASGTEEEGESDDTQNPKPDEPAPLIAVALKVLADAQRHGDTPPGRQVRGRQAAQLAERLIERFAAGWTPDDAFDALSDSLVAVDSVFGTLRWRIDNRLDGPPPARIVRPRSGPDRDTAQEAIDRCPDCDSKGRVEVVLQPPTQWDPQPKTGLRPCDHASVMAGAAS